MNCNLQFEFKNQTSKKAIISDMRHRIPYMYIDFQQNQVSRSLKTVHTNIFANNRQLHKIATINRNIEKKMIISEMHHRITYVYINFQQIRVNID